MSVEPSGRTHGLAVGDRDVERVAARVRRHDPAGPIRGGVPRAARRAVYVVTYSTAKAAGASRARSPASDIRQTAKRAKQRTTSSIHRQ